MPGFDSLEPQGKIEPAPRRDRLDLIVAGTHLNRRRPFI
jgi:hypothetical protein